MHAQKETFSTQVAELLRIDNVAMQAQQPMADSVHDANAVGAG
jgi:hypothetical protein